MRFTAELLFVVIVFACCSSAGGEDTDRIQTDGTETVVIIGPAGPVGVKQVGDNLKVCGDVQLAPNANRLVPIEGQSVVAALSKQSYGDKNNLISKDAFGDCEVELEFMIGKNSNSGVKLQQRYEVQLYDSHEIDHPSAKHCGGIYPHWKFRKSGSGLNYIDKGVPPRSNAALPAGQWQTLQIKFTAPKFDESGKKIANARFERVVLNGTTIHEDVSLDSPTGNASNPMPEVARAPLMLQLDHGAVAFRNVRVRQ